MSESARTVVRALVVIPPPDHRPRAERAPDKLQGAPTAPTQSWQQCGCAWRACARVWGVCVRGKQGQTCSGGMSACARESPEMGRRCNFFFRIKSQADAREQECAQQWQRDERQQQQQEQKVDAKGASGGARGRNQRAQGKSKGLEGSEPTDRVTAKRCAVGLVFFLSCALRVQRMTARGSQAGSVYRGANRSG